MRFRVKFMQAKVPKRKISLTKSPLLFFYDSSSARYLRKMEEFECIQWWTYSKNKLIVVSLVTLSFPERTWMQ